MARFAASAGPAKGTGGNLSSGRRTSAAADTAATATAGDPTPTLFMHVSNPAYDVQGAYEAIQDPEAAFSMPRSPPTRILKPVTHTSRGFWRGLGTRGLAPTLSATAGRLRPAGRRKGSAEARLPALAARPTYEDDGGYMDVQGTLPHRQKSDVSLITDTGLGRQESDVLLIADFSSIPRRLSSMSEL